MSLGDEKDKEKAIQVVSTGMVEQDVLKVYRAKVAKEAQKWAASEIKLGKDNRPDAQKNTAP